VETSLNAPIVDAVLPAMSLPLAAPKAGQVTQDAVDEAILPAATFEVFFGCYFQHDNSIKDLISLYRDNNTSKVSLIITYILRSWPMILIVCG